MTNQFPKIINYAAGIVLFAAHIVPFFAPEWFFGNLYQIEFTSPQSRTVLRTLSGVLAAIGLLWIYLAATVPNQRGLLKATLVLTFSFVIGRVFGLLADGMEQTLTYYELGFESLSFFITLWVYRSAKHAK